MSVGVKVTDSVWLPGGRTVPDPGVYANVPGTVVPCTIAPAFNCVAPSGVPETMLAGGFQVISGGTRTFTVAVAVTEPAVPVAVSRYDVLIVGFTMSVPDEGTGPM